ncbi:hypothetical protein V2J09_016926 [Rumex salicifolius]
MASDDKQKHQQLRPHAQFAVGSDIEVTSDEEGFRGIWFPAKLLSLPSKKRRNKYFVEYKSLVSEENESDPLTEFVDPSFLRPALTTEEGDEGSFEVNDVVEAYHLDGWWIGVVVAVLGERIYRVFFNNPPEEVEYERSSLRLHKDWVDGKWILPEKKTAQDEIYYGSSTNKKAQQREEEHGRKLELEIRTPGKSAAGKDTLEKENAAGHIVIDGIRANLAKESEHSNMDNTKESPQVTGGNETLGKSTRQRKSVYESCMLSLKPVRKKQRMTTEALPSTQESEASPKCIAQFEANPKCIAVSEPVSSGGAGNINDDDNPLSRRLADSHSPPIMVHSTENEGEAHVPNKTIEHNDSMNIAENATKMLPFTKTSPIWKVVEEMEVLQRIPQNPHFQPLYEAKEDCREGLAIGYMVTFSNLVEKTSKLDFGDPKNIIEDSLDTLADLERHGFDVHLIRARLDKLFSIKSGHECSQNEFNHIKIEIEERQSQKAVFEKEIDEIEKKIDVLRMKRELAVSQVERKKCEIEELESTMEYVKCCLKACQEEFERFVNDPW